MKGLIKRSGLLFGIGVIIFLTASYAFTGENLVANGGFEKELENWYPASPEGSDLTSTISSDAHAGEKCLKMSQTTGTWAYTCQRDRFAIDKSKVYRLEFWAKNVDCLNASVCLVGYDEKGKFLNWAGKPGSTVSIPIKNTWVKYSRDFCGEDFKPETGLGSIQLMILKPGTVYFDDIYFSTGPPEETTLVSKKETARISRSQKEQKKEPKNRKGECAYYKICRVIQSS
ncbi:MAG: carbohydrate binding domain-containing protein [bacterium]